jgi:hypothetical protein
MEAVNRATVILSATRGPFVLGPGAGRRGLLRRRGRVDAAIGGSAGRRGGGFFRLRPARRGAYGAQFGFWTDARAPPGVTWWRGAHLPTRRDPVAFRSCSRRQAAHLHALCRGRRRLPEALRRGRGQELRGLHTDWVGTGDVRLSSPRMCVSASSSESRPREAFRSRGSRDRSPAPEKERS